MIDYEKFYYKKAKEKSGFENGPRRRILDFIENNQKERDGQIFVLELGCGEGEFSNIFSDKIDYTGVDVSDFAIESAKKKNISGLGKFVLIDHISSKLPFESKKFDFVFGVYSLEHFNRPKEMLDEAARILKPGGHLILLAPNLEFPLSYINAARHKNFFYKTKLHATRARDYFMRIAGRSKFRVLEDNFTSATGKYERLDDDLSYIVSSYEVINYLKNKHNMKEIFSNKIGNENNANGLKGKVKKIVALLPAMEYYGSVLFTIMQK